MKKDIHHNLIDTLDKFISEALVNECDSIYLIDQNNNTYSSIKTSPLLDSILTEDGDYFSFCKLLFLNGFHDQYDKSYNGFINMGIPKEKPFLRQIYIRAESRIYNMFFLFIPAKTEGNALVFLFHNQDHFVSSSLQTSEQAAIEDGLLYSMIVNLDQDECYDIRVHEITQYPQQNVMHILFSEWRNIICTSILPDFRSIFLEKTDASDIRNTLMTDDRYWFDLQMRKMDGDVIWTRHALIRIKDESQNGLTFIYLVQDIQVEKEKQLKFFYNLKTHSPDLQDDADQTEKDSTNTEHFSPLAHIILKQVETELREHYMENLSLKQIGKKYYINSVYLGQLFSRKFGISFRKYLAKQRMEAAAILLMETDTPINKVSEKVGILNPYYFSSQFHSYFGCTPQEYRNRQ